MILYVVVKDELFSASGAGDCFDLTFEHCCKSLLRLLQITLARAMRIFMKEGRVLFDAIARGFVLCVLDCLEFLVPVMLLHWMTRAEK